MHLLKTSDNSPEGLDGGMTSLIPTRVICVSLNSKGRVRKSNELSLFIMHTMTASYHEIIHPDFLLGARYEDAQLPTAEHPQPVQANHIGQTIPEILNDNFSNTCLKCSNKYL